MADDAIPAEDLPPGTRRFVERHIDGIEQLEILLLLQRESTRSWDASAVAQSLHLDPPRAADHLEALSRRGLLDVRIGSAVMYRFGPVTSALALEVKRVADAYKDRRPELFALLTSRRLRSLRDFSDSFKLTEDPEDG